MTSNASSACVLSFLCFLSFSPNAAAAYFKVLSHRRLQGLKKKPRSLPSVSGPRFEPETTRIYTLTSTAMFDTLRKVYYRTSTEDNLQRRPLLSKPLADMENGYM
jgi:hypothetical protein